VLSALARLFAANDPPTGRISSRQLAERIRISRPKVQRALDTLNHRDLIAIREGTATSPAAYSLTFLRIKPMGGSLRMPPPEKIPPLFHNPEAPLSSQGGSLGMPPDQNSMEMVAPLSSQGGSLRMPPAAGHGDARARSDSIDTSDSIIDRLVNARAKQFDPREIAEARRWVHGYQLKCGRDRNAHPPDDEIIAQILTAANGLAGVTNLIQNLMADKRGGTEPGHQYSWYVAVALQRVHGIPPAVFQKLKADLRLMRPASRPAIAGEQQPLIDEFGADLVDDVMKKRRAKGASR
jgi:hypothetical protein